MAIAKLRRSKFIVKWRTRHFVRIPPSTRKGSIRQINVLSPLSVRRTAPRATTPPVNNTRKPARDPDPNPEPLVQRKTHSKRRRRPRQHDGEVPDPDLANDGGQYQHSDSRTRDTHEDARARVLDEPAARERGEQHHAEPEAYERREAKHGRGRGVDRVEWRLGRVEQATDDVGGHDDAEEQGEGQDDAEFATSGGGGGGHDREQRACVRLLL
ncbi:hypothetical protein MN608_06389 [Microdochium nivale]|nr:hypothetical protein MN608_06389 [Microdochium nivale]